MAVVVEEAAEGELVEGVLGVLAVAEPAVERVVEVAVAVAAAQLLRVHGVKVGGVRGVGDGGHVRRRLLPQVAGEVGVLEERVGLDLVDAVFAEALLGAAAQVGDEVGRLGAELGRRRNVQHVLPVYHLATGGRGDSERRGGDAAPFKWRVPHVPSSASPGAWSPRREAVPPPFHTR